MSHNGLAKKLLDLLNQIFHFQDFRPGQLEALMTLMEHGRLLCIQPTGHGKSLLYQLPSVILEGITLVISPLLALMRDQLIQLEKRFGIAAASINTDQSYQENLQTKHAAQMGKIRILFISPEQLDRLDRFEFLLNLPINLLVVDEAHCISTWGHDFRPSYRLIIQLVRAFATKNPNIKLLALTATANHKTEIDIKKQLTIDTRKILVHRETMDRPNIRLTVFHADGTIAKLQRLTHLLDNLEGSGLIYCATRENTELIAEFLRSRGMNTVAYHAGIERTEKLRIQTQFVQDKYRVISATNALGMGIDKPNIRFIIHFDFPGSITAYYQEVGRCGRDGLAAEGILIYDPADRKIQKHFVESALPNPNDFESLIHIFKTTRTPLTLKDLKHLSGLHPNRLNVILAELIEQQFLTKTIHQDRQVYTSTDILTANEFSARRAKLDLSRYTNQYAAKINELSAIQHYAEQSKQCLMWFLRERLGDKPTQNCGQCSICERGRRQECTQKYMTAATEFCNKAENSLAKSMQPSLAFDISYWLTTKTIPITLNSKIPHLCRGAAVINGKSRSKDFIYFMKNRAMEKMEKSKDLGITPQLLEAVKTSLEKLAQQYAFGCLIVLPSRTWQAREACTKLFANFLGIPALLNSLEWQKIPSFRQGELLNHEQRQHNVMNCLKINTAHKIPKGAILLFDDYSGSGATFNEAARVLVEQAKITQEIVPFAIALVQWRIGKSGIV